MEKNINDVEKIENFDREKRVEIRLSDEELLLIEKFAVSNNLDFKSSARLIYGVLSICVGFSPRVEKPRSQRGQGRPKGVKNRRKTPENSFNFDA